MASEVTQEARPNSDEGEDSSEEAYKFVYFKVPDQTEQSTYRINNWILPNQTEVFFKSKTGAKVNGNRSKCP